MDYCSFNTKPKKEGNVGYWDGTEDYLRRNGCAPNCGACGNPMFPMDDHGRFACFCGGRGSKLDVVAGISSSSAAGAIPQVDVTGTEDEQIAIILPINRPDAQPAADERDLLGANLDILDEEW